MWQLPLKKRFTAQQNDSGDGSQKIKDETEMSKDAEDSEYEETLTENEDNIKLSSSLPNRRWCDPMVFRASVVSGQLVENDLGHLVITNNIRFKEEVFSSEPSQPTSHNFLTPMDRTLTDTFDMICQDLSQPNSLNLTVKLGEDQRNPLDMTVKPEDDQANPLDMTVKLEYDQSNPLDMTVKLEEGQTNPLDLTVTLEDDQQTPLDLMIISENKTLEEETMTDLVIGNEACDLSRMSSCSIDKSHDKPVQHSRDFINPYQTNTTPNRSYKSHDKLVKSSPDFIKLYQTSTTPIRPRQTSQCRIQEDQTTQCKLKLDRMNHCNRKSDISTTSQFKETTYQSYKNNNNQIKITNIERYNNNDNFTKPSTVVKRKETYSKEKVKENKSSIIVSETPTEVTENCTTQSTVSNTYLELLEKDSSVEGTSSFNGIVPPTFKLDNGDKYEQNNVLNIIMSVPESTGSQTFSNGEGLIGLSSHDDLINCESPLTKINNQGTPDDLNNSRTASVSVKFLYSCSQCDKQYTDHSNLSRHRRISHKKMKGEIDEKKGIVQRIERTVENAYDPPPPLKKAKITYDHIKTENLTTIKYEDFNGEVKEDPEAITIGRPEDTTVVIEVKEEPEVITLGRLEDTNISHILRSKFQSSDPPVLWNTLIGLLRSRHWRHTRLIQWTNPTDLIFRVIDPEGVAKMWGRIIREYDMDWRSVMKTLYFYSKSGLMAATGEDYEFQLLEVPDCIKKEICKENTRGLSYRDRSSQADGKTNHRNENGTKSRQKSKEIKEKLGQPHENSIPKTKCLELKEKYPASSKKYPQPGMSMNVPDESSVLHYQPVDLIYV